MPDDKAPSPKPSRQYWLVPLEFVWPFFTVHHRRTLCIYAGLHPDYGVTDWHDLNDVQQRKIHTAFLRQYGVIKTPTQGAAG